MFRTAIWCGFVLGVNAGFAWVVHAGTVPSCPGMKGVALDHCRSFAPGGAIERGVAIVSWVVADGVLGWLTWLGRGGRDLSLDNILVPGFGWIRGIALPKRYSWRDKDRRRSP